MQESDSVRDCREVRALFSVITLLFVLLIAGSFDTSDAEGALALSMIGAYGLAATLPLWGLYRKRMGALPAAACIAFGLFCVMECLAIINQRCETTYVHWYDQYDMLRVSIPAWLLFSFRGLIRRQG